MLSLLSALQPFVGLAFGQDLPGGAVHGAVRAGAGCPAVILSSDAIMIDAAAVAADGRSTGATGGVELSDERGMPVPFRLAPWAGYWVVRPTDPLVAGGRVRLGAGGATLCEWVVSSGTRTAPGWDGGFGAWPRVDRDGQVTDRWTLLVAASDLAEPTWLDVWTVGWSNGVRVVSATSPLREFPLPVGRNGLVSIDVDAGMAPTPTMLRLRVRNAALQFSATCFDVTLATSPKNGYFLAFNSTRRHLVVERRGTHGATVGLSGTVATACERLPGEPLDGGP